MALWGGRFEAGVAEVTQEFGASLPVDKHLYKQDIAGSKAHAKMLAAQGIISAEDEQAIAEGLTGIEQDIDAGNFTFDITDEDIHMSIESELTRRIGEAGKRLHTGRSRNDQVATDSRLGVKALAKELMEANLQLRHVLVDAAKKYDKVILPGYTHMQHAQPVLLSHHLLAYSWMFARDFTRLKAAFDAADNCPLGAAALAGTSYPLDRQMTAAELGFAGVIPNSLDAVSDRDFLLDLHYAGSVMAMHLSRLSEEIVLWSSSEFGFITLSDSYSTGSSIMPQKKNPFTLEHMKGLAGHMEGFVVGIYSCMKNIIYSHSKDTSVEATRYLYEAMHDMEIDFTLANITIGTLTVKKDRMRDNALRNFCTVTELANYLVRYDDISFRQAHHIVADVVGNLCKEGLDSSHIDRTRVNEAMKEQLGAETKLTDELIKEALDPSRIAEAKKCIGGTSAEEVKRQLDLLEEQIDADEKVLADRLMYLAQAKEELNVAVKKLENS